MLLFKIRAIICLRRPIRFDSILHNLSVQSAVLCCPHVRGSLVFVRHSTFDHSFWVVPPSPPLFPLYTYYISLRGALLPFCVGAYGWVARICQPWQQSPVGAGCQRWKLLDVGALNLQLVLLLHFKPILMC